MLWCFLIQFLCMSVNYTFIMVIGDIQCIVAHIGFQKWIFGLQLLENWLIKTFFCGSHIAKTVNQLGNVLKRLEEMGHKEWTGNIKRAI